MTFSERLLLSFLAATNHSLGFQTAFDIVQKTMHKSQGMNMGMYYLYI